VFVSEAVWEYVDDREGRGEIGARTAYELRTRLLKMARQMGDPPLEHFGPTAVAKWQRSVAHQRASTRQTLCSTLSGFCRWLLQEGLIEQDPTLRLGRVRLPVSVPKTLNAAQMARLQRVLPDARARAIIALQSRLGLRCIEVANLMVADWDRDTGTLVVRGKFDNQRRLPVPDDVARVLDAYLGGRTDGPLVGGTAPYLSRQVSLWMDKAGIKTAPRDGLSAHALRRTAASDLYDQTKDVRLAQRLLGHRSIATTDRYLRPGDLDELRAALRR